MLQHRIIATRGKTWQLRRNIDRKSSATVQVEDAPWLNAGSTLLSALRGGVARLLRWSGFAVLLSPVLFALPFLVLRQSHEWAGLIVVAFSCTVVIFFALLNAFVLVTLLLHLQGRRRTLRWPSHDLDAFHAATEALAALVRGRAPYGDELKRVKGRLVSIGAPADGDVLMRGAASRQRDFMAFEASDAALVTDAGEIYILRFDGDFFVFGGEPRRGARPDIGEGIRTELARLGKGSVEDADDVLWQQLSSGDRVEVVGVPHGGVARVDAFELGGERRGVRIDQSVDNPYRGGGAQPGVILSATSTYPLLVRAAS